MKVAVLLSGGVDSSVALKLLQEEGHRVSAFYLKVWLADDPLGFGDCPWQEDMAYAEALCRQLQVPLKVLPMQQEYYARVVSYALEELRGGFTPSPDLFCNRFVKFGAFLDRIGTEFERVATGHYARLQRGQGAILLERSPDRIKDQTYFLSHLDRGQLERALFPVGQMTKAEVRALARQYCLPTQDRPDSQGLCFLGRIDYRQFLRHFLGERPGPIVERDSGRLLGEHKGHWYHTIGQRAGLGLSGGPWYVVAKDPQANRIVVSHRHRLAAQARDRFHVANPHWIGAPPARGARLQVKLRHGEKLIEALAKPASDGSHRGCWEVLLSEADPGIAPGQAS
jgi:tRNA-specific 2-thiouridylase